MSVATGGMNVVSCHWWELSSLTFASPQADPNLVEIALACFDDEVPVKPDAHIFVASAASWAKPSDDLPQYEAGRDSKLL